MAKRQSERPDSGEMEKALVIHEELLCGEGSGG